jgi:hypothetical protein
MYQLTIALAESPRSRTDSFAAIELDWHQSAQLFLALSVLDRAFRDSRPRGQEPTESDRFIDMKLEQLRRMLEFPAGYESPKQGPAFNRLPAEHADYAQAINEVLRVIDRRLNK